jgi:hypothetical protein
LWGGGVVAITDEIFSLCILNLDAVMPLLFGKSLAIPIVFVVLQSLQVAKLWKQPRCPTTDE